MQFRPIRYLPHILVGIVAFATAPRTAVCSDASATRVEPPANPSGDAVVAPAIDANPVADLLALPEGTPGERDAKSKQLFWGAERIFYSEGGDLENGRKLMVAAAALGLSQADFELGRFYIAGLNGFEKSADKGRRHFEAAAGQGVGFAMVATGQCYFEGTGADKDLKVAERWLRKALEEGTSFSRLSPPADSAPMPETVEVAGALWTDPEISSKAAAHYFLAKIAEENKDDAAAHAEFVAAAYQGIDGRDGILDAAHQAAYDFACGRGTRQDFEKGREMIDHSRVLAKRFVISRIQTMVQERQLDAFAAADAEETGIKTTELLTDLYVLGLGTTLADPKEKSYNPQEAVKWIGFAASRDVPTARMRLAELYGGKRLGAPNPEEAFKWWKEAVGEDPKKVPLATANLAICLQNGIGTTRDAAVAAALFARIKDDSFVGYLGTIGKAPTAPVTAEQEAKLLETWANQKRDAHAQFLLGREIYKGEGKKKEVEASVALLKKAAKGKDPGANVLLGRFSEALGGFAPARKSLGLKDPLDYFKRASELGSAEGARSAGNLFLSDKATPSDLKQAEQYFRKAMQLDPKDAVAHQNLAEVFQLRLRASKDAGKPDSADNRASMLAEYGEACRLGSSAAQTDLAKLHLAGELVTQDYDKAYDLLTKAAEDGSPEPHYQLGVMHEEGKGVPVTYTEAAYHYRIAALGGKFLASDRLVDFYLTGKGVNRDLGFAELWIRQGIELGNRRGNLELGEVLIARKRFSEALRLYKELAKNSNRELSGIGFYGLAECYTHGYGVEADPVVSQGYMALAIGAGNPEALVNLANTCFSQKNAREGVRTMELAAKESGQASYFLGQMYYFGTNVEKDRARSLDLMRDAARMRYSKAMYFLAAATFNRDPDAPDLDEAIQFASMAENMGVPNAQSLRERLERRRDRQVEETEQVARARSG